MKHWNGINKMSERIEGAITKFSLINFKFRPEFKYNSMNLNNIKLHIMSL